MIDILFHRNIFREQDYEQDTQLEINAIRDDKMVKDYTAFIWSGKVISDWAGGFI